MFAGLHGAGHALCSLPRIRITGAPACTPLPGAPCWPAKSSTVRPPRLAAQFSREARKASASLRMAILLAARARGRLALPGSPRKDLSTYGQSPPRIVGQGPPARSTRLRQAHSLSQGAKLRSKRRAASARTRRCHSLASGERLPAVWRCGERALAPRLGAAVADALARAGAPPADRAKKPPCQWRRGGLEFGRGRSAIRRPPCRFHP